MVERERLNIRATDLDHDPSKTLWRSIETGQHLLRMLRLSATRAAEAVAHFKSPLNYELTDPGQNGSEQRQEIEASPRKSS